MPGRRWRDRRAMMAWRNSQQAEDLAAAAHAMHEEARKRNDEWRSAATATPAPRLTNHVGEPGV